MSADLHLATVPSTPQARPDSRFQRPERLAFVVGGQKCGTNWVHRYLMGHPDTCVPLLKETGYWASVRPPHRPNLRLKKEAQREAQKGALHRLASGVLRARFHRTLEMVSRFEQDGASGSHSAYADVLFQNYRGQSVACEVDPANALLGRETYAEMARLGRDVRFALIMRDPLARLKSGVRHTVYNRHGEKGVTDARIAEVLQEVVTAGPRHLTFQRSRYDATVAELDAAVPQEKLGYFFYETFFTPQELARFTAFLGVAPRPARLDRVSHAGAGGKVTFPADLIARATEILAPTYSALRRRFGDAIPAAWLAQGDTNVTAHHADDDGSMKEQMS